MMDKIHCHIISNTHWDREWRYPFQAYRMDLIDMMDRLLDILEKEPEYRAFFLDSQTVILEDYLEIRPQNEERIKKLVKDDRLQIGPWYTLPDEWACPGEALVRNLLMGHKTAARFGNVSKVGYTPFSNGQISQLPQLYQGFEIDSCFFYRGIGKHVAKSDFIWESPDGSQVFGFRFGDYARYNYYFLIYRPGLLNRFTTERDYKWNPEEVPFHVANPQSQDRQYSWMRQKLQVRDENLDKALAEARQYTDKDACTSQLLYMMGHDHSYGASEEIDLIRAIQNHINLEHEEVFHSSLSDYMKAFREEAKDLQVLLGEMRHTNKEGLWTNLMALILSCRLYLKQINNQVNNKILAVAEPLASCAWLAGSEYPAPYFDIAWKKLLINQAHDAIGGCSVDRVHEEMLARWSEVDTLADEICRRSMRDITNQIDGSSIDSDDMQLTVFNSRPFNRDDTAELLIDLPHGKSGDSFCIQNLDGETVPIQILESDSYSPTIEGGYELPMPFDVQRHRALVQLKELPAMGYETFAIKRGECDQVSDLVIAKSDTKLENEFIRVQVNRNGTLKLTDKQTGKVYDRLGYFEDTAEFGDPWNRVIPENDTPLYTRNNRAKSKVVLNGPLRGTLEISLKFKVPANKGKDENRSAEKVEIPIRIQVSLDKDSSTVDLKVDLDNRASDHRLRMLFPSSIPKATYSTAEGQFDVLSRPIALPDTTGWKEAPYPTHPMWQFVDVNDGKRGLAVINDGLTEYEVIDDKPRTIAITLLRAFGKFVFGRPTPGSQCLGKQTYRFRIVPHAGDWQQANLFHQKDRFSTPIQAIQSAPTKGTEKTRKSFLSLNTKSVVLSSVKQSEDGKSLVVRVWNSADQEQPFSLESALEIENVTELTLEEKVIRKIDVEDCHRLELFIPGKKIMTLAFCF